FLTDGNNGLKYRIFKTFLGVFQNKYEKSSYYEFQVPNEWVLIKKKEDYLTFLSPVWNKNDEISSAIVFTNYDSFQDYVHWFDTSFCQQVDEVVSIFNKAKLLPSQNIIDIPSEIIFCNKHVDKGHSYIVYLSHGAITYILVEPYDSSYKAKYIELFKTIDYILDEKDTPQWVKEP
ncbi:MAG: hypothetical protein J7J31_03835, partial [Helicobacteraceae bacterium]|nr:hypothetical protein [Helicobacteraceae bacterium]